MNVADLPTPALIVDLDAVDRNVDAMAAVRPGRTLRPHVKALKSTELARYVGIRGGHDSFCAATLKEIEGLIAAAVGNDLLLANETLDAERLTRCAAAAAGAPNRPRLAVAVDSPETIDVAAAALSGGPLGVLIDVNVGLPRCGCDPAEAGELAGFAVSAGLRVDGVMGYEGHLMSTIERPARATGVETSMQLLRRARDQVGGYSSAGGTGTFDLHDWVDEVQAGSYVLMDTAYARHQLGFEQALYVDATVVSTHPRDGYAVANAGLKAFGMDHGEPTVIGFEMFFCSDEHVTFLTPPDRTVAVGDRVRMIPGHVDPTLAYHETMHAVRGDRVEESWPVDLRGW
jgi:D-serine deaminase-like pyridoxal phosphate-dependent protein